jgi:hypothetical protein
MRRLLGRFTLAVSLGVLLASIGAGEVKAAYQLSITITDNTHPSTTTFAIAQTSPNNAFAGVNPNLISPIATFSTASTGVTLTGLLATSSTSATSTSLQIQGTATITGSGPNLNTDSYTVVINTTNTGYTLPTGTVATLSQSESGTYNYTGAGNTQLFQSWYNSSPSATPPVTSGTTPGQQSIPIPVAGASTLSGSQNVPGSITFGGYIQPYALANQITLNITGQGTPNTSAGFQGSTTIMAVPEPASLVMFMTGMPVPLMVLGMLRRRKVRRNANLVA